VFIPVIVKHAMYKAPKGDEWLVAVDGKASPGMTESVKDHRSQPRQSSMWRYFVNAGREGGRSVDGQKVPTMARSFRPRLSSFPNQPMASL